MPGPASSPTRRHSFWRRRLVDPLVQQLTQGVSPEKIALTIAVGTALALFPILGTTTALCTAAGVTLGLNQPIIQGLNLVCGFIWIPLLVAFVRLGDFVTRTASPSLALPTLFAAFRHHPWQFFHRYGLTAWHGVLGWAIFAVLWVPLAYFIARPLLRVASRRLHHHSASAGTR
jgi:uncharacterized protein (DUF2062 family)